MIGMGMPISQSRMERMVSPDVVPGETHIRRQAFLLRRTVWVLRWRRLLDCQLDTYLKVPTVRLDPEVAVTLRIGLYQLRYLQRVPARAGAARPIRSWNSPKR